MKLYCMDGYKLEQVSDMVSRSKNTVSSQVGRTCRKLQNRINYYWSKDEKILVKHERKF